MRFSVLIILLSLLIPRELTAQQAYTCPITCNNDFENNQVTNIFQGLVFANQNNIDCWSTTAPDGLLEVWRNGQNGVPSYSGLQFIELNANYASSIFQDFPAPNGSTAQISFAHRGRAGTDVMSVEIGPVGGPYQSLGNFSAGNTAWVYNTVNFTFPVGANGTWRISFTSVSSAVNNQTIGNFIDAISISLTGITLSPTVVQPSCPGRPDGALNLILSGGVAPYTYAWNAAGLSGSNPTGLLAGNYTCTITDQLGCTFFFDTVLVAPPALQAQTTSTLTQCGASTGTAQVVASGGTPGYSYVWSSGTASQQATGLAAGSYTVIVTDAQGCTAVFSQAVSAATAPVISAVQTNPAFCYGSSSGSAQIQVTASSGYSTMWSTGTTGTTVSNLSAGTYTVTVTDANNCSALANVTITQPLQINLQAQADSVSCFGGSDGMIDLTPSGGTSGYSYAWNNGSSLQDPTNLPAGVYTVTVTDAAGCSAALTTNVQSPPPLQSTVTPAPVSCYGAADGSISVAVQGGISGYNYLWSNGAGVQSPSSLVAGTYTVTVTDQNGCTMQATGTIIQPTSLVLNATPTNINCFGNSTGSIDLNVAGGTPIYQYAWSNGVVTQDVQALSAGIYTVTVSDNRGCTLSLAIQVNQSPQLLLQTQAINAVCSGSGASSVDLTVSGGSGTYTYLWSTGANSQDIGQLADGTYTVTVTDGQGCTALATAVLSSQTTPIQISATPQDLSCNGDSSGSISLQIQGGAPGYAYAWSNGTQTQNPTGLQAGNYSVVVTDNNGCTATVSALVQEPPLLIVQHSVTNVICGGLATGAINLSASGGTGALNYQWSSGQNTPNISGITGGNYTVVVTDSRQCTLSAQISVYEPPPIQLQTTVTNAACNGSGLSAIDLTPSGGTGTWSYQWSTAAITQDLTGIGNGTYSVLVSDASGCTAQAIATISEPAPLAVSGIVSDLLCHADQSGSIDFSAAGGVGVLAYSWSSGQASQDLTSLSAGSYTVVVSDANGCTETASFTVQQPSPLILAIATSPVTCPGGSDGNADISVSGGTGLLQYSWSTGQSVEDLAQVSAGSYAVVVTDDNGCTATSLALIQQPAPIVVAAQVSDPGCSGLASGSIDISVNGGSPGYQYVWSSGQVTQDLQNVPSNAYTVTVSDSQGCTESLSAVINEPLPLSVSLTPTSILCHGDLSGSISSSVSGGTPGYMYLWSTGSAAAQIQGVGAGTYTCLVTDTYGCTQNVQATVNEPPPIQSTVNATPALCAGDSTGTIDLQVIGGVPGYLFSWSNTANSEDITAITAGMYSVTITDANGCTQRDSALVEEPLAVQLTVSGQDIPCHGDSTGTIAAQVTGGTAPYLFTWNNGSSLASMNGLTAGQYTVLMTDANGCTAGSSLSITQPTAITASVVAQDLLCNGDQTGSVDLQVAGGVAPYLFDWSNGAISEDLLSVSAGTYQVSITDANGCVQLASTILNQPAALNSSLSANEVSCYGLSDGSISVTGTGGTQPYQYTWNNGQVQSGLNGIPAGSYSVLLTDANGCTVSGSVSIGQPDPLVLDLPGIGPVFVGQDATLNVAVTGGSPGYSYLWNDGTVAPALQITPDETESYTITVTDSRGCTSVASIIVEVPDDHAFYAPNTFTPNDDGRNEGFTGYGIGLDRCSFSIYDRWGKEVYRTESCDFPWNGTFFNAGQVCPEGVYVYRFEVLTRKGLSRIFQGQVRLVR